MPGRKFGKLSGSLIKVRHHSRCGTFLRGKDLSGTVDATQRILDIGSNGETDITEFTDVIKRTLFRPRIDKSLEHAHAGIAGSTAAKSDNDVFRATADGIDHQLTGTVTRSHHRITLFWRQQRQTAGLGNFYHRLVATQQIAGSDGTHQRVAHYDFLQFAPQCRMKRLQESLATIADRHLHDFCVRTHTQYAFRRCPIRLY